jgi:hypothetical protein
MNIHLSGIDIFLLLFACGVIYFSRFILRNYPKVTGADLKNINPKFEGIQYKYIVLYIVTVLPVIFFSFLMLNSNLNIWKTASYIAILPIFAYVAFFDGCFTIITNVFPTLTRYSWNKFVYDGDKKLRWVAICQIFLAVILLIADFVVFVNRS